ncbi:MAG: hypothetical protein C0453_04450, partial [Comamonadaceae bacterium]|nr:hypothetical protein [Comamonadaceae bacterium]
MLTEVLWMGVREAGKLMPCPATVIISILDQFEEHARPEQLNEFADHLVLDFVDTFEKPGEPEWPDQLTKEENKSACTWDDDRAPELADAQKIAAFVATHHATSKPTKLVVHCHGGVSRSAAVAKWVGATYGIPMPQLGDGIHRLEGANPRVLRLLQKTKRG